MIAGKLIRMKKVDESLMESNDGEFAYQCNCGSFQFSLHNDGEIVCIECEGAIPDMEWGMKEICPVCEDKGFKKISANKCIACGEKLNGND